MRRRLAVGFMKLKKDALANSRGAAMLEFAITIPLFLALLVGLVSTGNELSNLVFLNQVVYNSALKGSQLDEASRETGMRTRAEDLLKLGRHKFKDDFIKARGNLIPLASDENRTVGLEIDAPLKKLVFFANDGDQASQLINAPLLTPRIKVSGDMTDFQNPVDEVRWNGGPGSGGGDPGNTTPPNDPPGEAIRH